MEPNRFKSQEKKEEKKKKIQCVINVRSMTGTQPYTKGTVSS